MKPFINKSVWFSLNISLIVFIFSCSTNHYCNEIVEHIEKNCFENAEKCKVDLKKVFSFDWDVLYVFTGYDDPLYISKVIGFDCECNIVPEYKKMYLFIKNEKIVQKKTLSCYEVQFIEMNNDEGTIQISSNQAEFKVEKSKRGNKNYYTLSPTEW